MIVSGIGVSDAGNMEAVAGSSDCFAWVSLRKAGGSLSIVNIFIDGRDNAARAQRMADAINAALVEPVAEQEQV